MSDLDAWLEAGSRPEATVNICLVGDLAAQYQTKAEQMVAVSQDPNRSMDDGRIVTLGQELEALQVKMEGATRVFTLRAMANAPDPAVSGPTTYLRLQLAHPPRDGDPIDERNGVNVDTFLPALVKACTVDPALSDEQWESLRGKLSSRQWDELWVTAQQLNREDVRAPKSLGSFGETPTSGAKQKPRGRSGSPSNGSAAGNRKRTTPTTPRGA